MKPVMQTLKGGSDVAPELRGNCLPACIASILEVDLSVIGNDHHAAEDRWLDVIEAKLADLRHAIAFLDTRWPPAAWWMAFVPSLNLTSFTPHGQCAGIGCTVCEFEGERVDGHVIVMFGERVAHDPSNGRRRYPVGERLNLRLVREGWALIPMGPTS